MEGKQFSSAEEQGENLSSIPEAGEQDFGVSARTLQELFTKHNELPEEEKSKFSFFASMYQIYNEQIFDLLNFGSVNGGSENQDMKR